MAQMLADERIHMHAFVLGELRMGNLPERRQTLEYLGELHWADLAQDDEVAHLIESRRLFGLGLSWVDAHLLTSVVLSPGLKLWTRDRRLNEAARRFDRAASLHH